MDTSTLSAARRALIGRAGTESLEMRIFLAVDLICMAVLAVTATFNYIIGLPELSWLMTGVFLITCGLYYLARFKRRLNVSIVLFSITFNVLLAANFFYNSGINGPTLLGFMLSFFVTTAIAPQKHYWVWLTVNIVLVFSLLGLGEFYPQLLRVNYTDSISRLEDFSYTYLVVSLLVLMVTTRIRKSYIQEKTLAEQKASELERSNTTKNKLFSILAHDLRSPLSSIQNFLEILAEYKLGDEERQTIQRALLNETLHTQQMLSNVLSWTKEQMDGVTVSLKPVSVPETLDITLKVQATAASEKCIILKNELPPECCVVADPDMLQLVIRNLVNNAVKFTQPGGEIVVSAKQEKECWRVTVSDNGIGIPYEQQDDVFSMQAKSTFGTNNEKGIGLGLMLCREFTELQQGRIGFQSIPGKGTTFFISLPSCELTAQPPVERGKQVLN